MVKKSALSNPVQKKSKAKSYSKRKKILEDLKQIETEKDNLNTAEIDSSEIKRRVYNILKKTINFSNNINKPTKNKFKIKKIKQKISDNGKLSFKISI